jgi:hypothetical protein
MIKIEYQDEKLRKKLVEYTALCKKDSAQVVQNIGRVCALECMKRTYPYGTNNQARDQGLAAITNDLRKIFVWVTPASWKLLKAFTRKKNPLTELKSDSGKAWATSSQEQITDASGAKGFHRRNRTSNGRTKRLPLLEKALVKKSAYKKFRTELQKRVGLAKAGWAIAATECRADVRAPLQGVPLWVKNNMANSEGSADASKAGKGLGFSMKIRSGVDYARAILEKSEENSAIQIAKGKMIKMMRKAIKYERVKQAGLKK